MLTALIVSAETLSPGAGFTKLAEHLGFEVEDPELFWQIELARVVDFWSSDDPTGSVDAAVECLMDELVAIKALLRAFFWKPDHSTSESESQPRTRIRPDWGCPRGSARTRGCRLFRATARAIELGHLRWIS